MVLRVFTAIALAAISVPSNAQHSAPTSLITTEDYPKEALRRHEEGTVRVKLTVGIDGRVKACSIVQSASPSLDAATCDILSKRAKFVPATSESGTPVEGEFTVPILWQIRDRKPAPPGIRM